MNITTIGMDLAKNVFQVHGVDEQGKVVLRKALKRAEVVKVFSTLPQRQYSAFAQSILTMRYCRPMMALGLQIMHP